MQKEYNEIQDFSKREKFNRKLITLKRLLLAAMLLTILFWYIINIGVVMLNSKKEGFDLMLSGFSYQPKNKNIYFPIIGISFILVIVYYL